MIALVLRVDSPGGSATASDLIYRELLRIRERMPVVVSMGNLAASGGYYIAMAGERIVASPGTITGSIGVYVGKMELSGLYEKVGLDQEELLRGASAGTWSDLAPFSPGQREAIEDRLEAFYARFIGRVAEHRSLDVDAVDAVARGRVWSGARAHEHGLVDELGGLDRAVAIALELAGRDAAGPVELRSYQPEPGLFDRLLARMFEPAIAVRPSAFDRLLTRSLAPVRAASLTLDGTTQFHLPWVLDIR